MKFIDEKGRLFGLKYCNLIDVIVVIFIVVFLRMLVLGYRLYQGNTKALAEEHEKARIAKLVKNLDSGQAQKQPKATIPRNELNKQPGSIIRLQKQIHQLQDQIEQIEKKQIPQLQDQIEQIEKNKKKSIGSFSKTKSNVSRYKTIYP